MEESSAVAVVVVMIVGFSIALPLVIRAIVKPPRHFPTLYALAIAVPIFLACLVSGIIAWFLKQPNALILIVIFLGSLAFASLVFVRFLVGFKVGNWGARKLRELQELQRRSSDESGTDSPREP